MCVERTILFASARCCLNWINSFDSESRSGSFCLFGWGFELKSTLLLSEKESVSNSLRIDPLHIILEHRLFHCAGSILDRKVFVSNVVNEYLEYLQTQDIVVPLSLVQKVREELILRVDRRMTARIYGFMTLSDFVSRQPRLDRWGVHFRYQCLRMGWV